MMSERKDEKRSTSNIIFGAFSFAALFFPVLLHSILGIAFSPVLSNSMAPGFRAGDLLITKEAPARSTKIGQVVILRAGADYQLYSHRVISVQRSSDQIAITTKGDANPTADADIARVNPLASIPHEIAHVPFLGRPIVYFSQHKFAVTGGFFLCLAAFLLILRWIGKRGAAEPTPIVLNEVPTPVIPQSLEVSAFEEEKKDKKNKKNKKEKSKKKNKKNKNKKPKK